MTSLSAYNRLSLKIAAYGLLTVLSAAYLGPRISRVATTVNEDQKILRSAPIPRAAALYVPENYSCNPVTETLFRGARIRNVLNGKITYGEPHVITDYNLSFLVRDSKTGKTRWVSGVVNAPVKRDKLGRPDPSAHYYDIGRYPSRPSCEAAGKIILERLRNIHEPARAF